MSKIIYIANIRLPTEKAHGIQVMKMCEAFSVLDTEVELVVPLRLNTIKKDSFEYYDVKQNFKIRRLPCLDTTFLGRIGFLFQALTFLFSVLFYVIPKKDVLYTREELIAWFLGVLGKKVIWEAHRGSYNFFVKQILKRGSKIVVISSHLREFYISLGADGDNILIARDGVDLEQFSINIFRIDARKKVGLPEDKKIVLYTGHLYEWKGVETLASATPFLPKDVLVVLVGGTEKEIEHLKDKYKNTQNINFLGNKPHAEIPYYLRAADVLVLPNSAKNDMSRLYTSPLKLFEYMASGTPIVASDLPSLREVLNEHNSVLAFPDDSNELAHCINTALIGGEKITQIISRALLDVKQYSWIKRGEGIIGYIFA